MPKEKHYKNTPWCKRFTVNLLGGPKVKVLLPVERILLPAKHGKNITMIICYTTSSYSMEIPSEDGKIKNISGPLLYSKNVLRED